MKTIPTSPYIYVHIGSLPIRHVSTGWILFFIILQLVWNKKKKAESFYCSSDFEVTDRLPKMYVLLLLLLVQASLGTRSETRTAQRSPRL